MIAKIYQFENPVIIEAYKKQLQDCIEQIKRRTETLKSLGNHSPNYVMTQEEADLIVAVADKIKDALAILHEPKE